MSGVKARSRTADKFVTAKHPERGTLWAAFDASTINTQGSVEERRFPAFLKPFQSREEAEAALIAAGATGGQGRGR
jgi:hypothetical protein